ncbi:hypothetical protein TMAG_00003, partial [Mycobacterium tuberculosis SUMu001]
MAGQDRTDLPCARRSATSTALSGGRWCFSCRCCRVGRRRHHRRRLRRLHRRRRGLHRASCPAEAA